MRSFDEIYNSLSSEKTKKIEEIEKLRKRQVIITLGIIVGAIILVAILVSPLLKNIPIFMIPFLIPAVFFSMSVAMVVIILVGKKTSYRTRFKKEIIETFIKECDSNLSFHPSGKMSPVTYAQGEFERYDNYYSEDLIDGMLDGKYLVSMAEVKTEDESTDSEGNTTTTTIFHGIFGQIESSKDILGFIKIHSDKGIFGKMFGQKNRVEMDSSEFEKNFDVYGTNPIVVMQILTSDIMEMLIDFKENSKINYEITIKGKKIYIRFHTGGVFEPKIFQKTLDYNMLKRYYDIIEFIFRVARSINKVIEEAEI